jgi:hypothetical protein
LVRLADVSFFFGKNVPVNSKAPIQKQGEENVPQEGLCLIEC